MSFRLLSIFLGLAMLVPSAFCATIHVPSDQPTIQAGINASSAGDTILVAPGTYNTGITFPTHQVVLKSSGGPGVTFIEYEGPAQQCVYSVDSDSGCVLAGFTFLDIDAPTYVVYINGVNELFTIENCRFYSCNAHDAIRAEGSVTLHAFHNVIASPLSENVIVTTGPDCQFINNTAVGATRGIAMYGENNIIVNNIVTDALQYAIWNPAATSTVDYNNFWNNATQNLPGPNGISADPQFLDAQGDDFGIQATSPCRDAGDPDPQYDDPDGSRSDIGAIPYIRPPMAIHVATTGDDLTGGGSIVNPYASIGKAVTEAQDGDSVLIHEGMYTGDANAGVNPAGKDLIVRGVGELGTVVIVPNVTSGDPDAALVFNSGETSATMISNLRFAMEGNVRLAIVADSASPTIDSCEFEQTTGIGTHQQAVILLNSTTVIANCSFVNFSRGCSACKDGHLLESSVIFGPALIVQESTDILISDCVFVGNYSDDRGSGGAAWFKNSNVAISRSSFTQNIVSRLGENSAIYGGGAILSEDCDLFIDSSLFNENQSPDEGGAIEVNGGYVEVQNCAFARNTSVIGGAIYADEAILTIGNSTLDSNRAYDAWQNWDGEGGAVAVRNSQLYFYQSLLLRNRADGREFEARGIGAHVHALNSTVDLEQTAMLYGRMAEAIATAGTTTSVTIACSNIFGNSLGDWVGPLTSLRDLNGNLRADPHLCDEAATPRSVAANSPLLAANNACGLDIGVAFEDCPAYGKSLYVDTLGVDSLADGSISAPFGTIQAAVDAAANGDTIAIQPGLYTGPGNEEIDLLGKAIVLQGTAGSDSTTAVSSGTVFWADEGEDSSTVIEGLTIEGAIVVDQSDLTVRQVKGDIEFRTAGCNVYLEDSEVLVAVTRLSNEGRVFIRRCNLLHTELAAYGVVVSLDSVTMVGTGTGRAISSDYVENVTIANSSITGYDVMINGSISATNCTFSCASLAVWHSVDDPSYDLSFFACRFEHIDSLVDLNWNASTVSWDSCVFDSIGSIGKAQSLPEDGPNVLLFNNCIFEDSDVSADLGFCAFSLRGCQLRGNTGTIVNTSRSVAPSWPTPDTVHVVQNTVVDQNGSLFHFPYIEDASIERNIFYSCSDPILIVGDLDTSNVTFSCNNIFPPSQDYLLDSLEVVIDTSSMHRVPLFCDPDNGDYSLAANSACLPAHNPYGVLIGADSLGCDSIIRTIHVSVSGSDSTGDGSDWKPFATIQHGINYSSNGDSVLVHPGEYVVQEGAPINTSGRAITVAGIKGIDSTVLLIPHSARGFQLESGEDSLTVISDLVIRGQTAIYAGQGMYLSEASPTIKGCIFEGLYIVSGAPAVASFGGTPRFDSCAFTGNLSGFTPFKMDQGFISPSSEPTSGAVSIVNGQPKFLNCEFSGNVIDGATEGAGGAMSYSGPLLVLESCLFKDNMLSADASYGGAIVGDSIVATDCTFRNNEANVGGGAIYGGGTFVDCVFEANWSRSGDGGAILGNGYFDGCSFIRNRTGDLDEYWGGGAVAGGGSFINCNFVENFAHGLGDGGAVKGSGLFEGCVFWKNSAGDESSAGSGDTANGGAVFGHGDFINCTFAQNAAYGASACELTGITSTFSECVIAFGSAIDSLGSALTGTALLSCTNIYGNSDGDWEGLIDTLLGVDGNISLDPLFCDTSSGDLTVLDVSPCAPENNSCGVLIGAVGVGCSGIPTASNVSLPGEDQVHVLSHTPTISWQFFSPGEFVQDSVEVAFGTDTTWLHAEMWNPSAFGTADTMLTYAGIPLVDGQTYYGRLRVHNSLVWSDWISFSFRMNSVPGLPIPQSPINQALVGQTPGLTLTNATDAEADGLVYDFQVFEDTALITSTVDIAETADSTGWTVDLPLADNTLHWWRTHAFDGFEYSDWSAPGYFWVDATPEAPSTSVCLYPPALPDSVISEQMPVFAWSAASDPDPQDTVRYRLITATDPDFTFQSTVDSLPDTTYAWPTELSLTQKYWWKVQAFDKSGLSTVSETRSFWVGFPGCCVGSTGNANGDPEDNVNLSDLTLMVNYLFVTFQPLVCKSEANTNGDAACGINLSDVTALVNYLFVSFEPVADCGDFAESACGTAVK